jgi:hypothetical protein
LEETLLKKGFFQAIFPKLLKVLGKGFKGETLFQKGFPLNLMTLFIKGAGGGASFEVGLRIAVMQVAGYWISVTSIQTLFLDMSV